MEEETRFRAGSPLEDYRSAIADSTCGRNSDPIPVSYRQISSTSGTSASGPSTTTTIVSGYVNNGGPDPIDMRPRQPEPAGETQGVGLEVEFDSKFTDAYANLDDVRDHNYHLARSPQNSVNPVYAGGVPNTARKVKREKKRACRSCILHSVISVLFVTNIAGLCLGAFNLANTYVIGTYTGAPTAAPVSSGLTQSVDQLRDQLEDMQHSFNMYNNFHMSNFTFVMAELQRLQAAIDGISPPPTTHPTYTDQDSMSETTPTPDTSAPPVVTAPPGQPTIDHISIPIYDNCSMTIRGTCPVSRSNVLGSEHSVIKYASCSTRQVPLEDDDGYLVDVFCSVSSTQNMPVTSTLRFNNGEWSCLCHAIEIPNGLQLEIADFECRMYERRCPSDIRIPRN